MPDDPEALFQSLADMAQVAAGGTANVRIPTDGLNADMHADAEYRDQLVCVLTRRAVARIVADGTPR